MRKYLLILLCFLSLSASATNYYVKNGGNDALAGTSDANAWETITKVNAVWNAGTFAPGDSILFNRGDTFYGSITISESGISGNPITLSAYGTGDKPKLSCFTTITGWSDYGSGIYSKSVSPETAPDMVTVDGVNTAMGRWPNSGWYTIDSHTNSPATITASELDDEVQDWDGAQVVIRKGHWVIDRCTITDHTDNTLTYTNPSSYTPNDGNGFFIQNHLATLTELGEWYYSSGTFYMYFGANDPDDYVVNVSTLDKNVYMTYMSYVTFDNLEITGGDLAGIRLYSSHHISITNCIISFIGTRGVDGGRSYGSTSEYLYINNCHFHDINDLGIYLSQEFDYPIITNNLIENICLLRGMFGSGDDHGTGITKGYMNNGAIIEYNVVQNIGYNGIDVDAGANNIVRYNFVKNYCLIKDDGGGIYMFSNNSGGNIIDYNIVIDGIGAPDGMYDGFATAEGIYIDTKCADVSVQNNVVSNVTLAGLMINNSHELTIKNNLIYDCDYSGVYFVHASDHPGDPIRNIDIDNNIFIAKSSTQYCMRFATYDNDADIQAFGTADYNYYARPINQGTNDYTIYTLPNAWGGPGTNRTLASTNSWKTYSSQDTNSNNCLAGSVASEDDIHFIYNETNYNKYYTLSAAMKDVENTDYSGTIALTPWTGLVLLGVGTVEELTQKYYLFHEGKLVTSGGLPVKIE